MEHLSSKKAELEKIAHTLSVKEEEIQFLSAHSEGELGFLFHAITNSIQKDQSEVWEPLAKVVKFIPNFLNAKVSEDVLGPHITANITYHVGVKDAISISNHFSNKFFADVMEHVVPEKIQHILTEAPYEKMKIVLLELIKRKNFYQISNLMDYVPIERAAKLTMEVKDYQTLSDVSYLSSKKERLWKILSTYNEERAKGFITASVKSGRADMIIEMYQAADESFKTKFKTYIESLDDDLKKEILSEIN